MKCLSTVTLLLCSCLALASERLLVTNVKDSGAGSLRAAILAANRKDSAASIVFESAKGMFDTPRTVILRSPLPTITGDLSISGYIEGRLWQPGGVTISGNNRVAIVNVAAGAQMNIQYLTIKEGHGERGAGVMNRGDLVIKNVTLHGNTATRGGAAVANLGGTLTLINSTVVANESGPPGGAITNMDGRLTVTNSTFSQNSGGQAGALVSEGTLTLRNSILANSDARADCLFRGAGQLVSTHNMIENDRGCGGVISNADPKLQPLGYYNGPTQTLPLGGGSRAINRGDNDSALDEEGKPLRWDQRGNGDPRRVGGITDLGAFERQRLPVLVIDTASDQDWRGCAPRVQQDCSLRGALALAHANRGADRILFDADVFAAQREIFVTQPLPPASGSVLLDAGSIGGITLCGSVARNLASQQAVTLNGITLSECTGQ